MQTTVDWRKVNLVLRAHLLCNHDNDAEDEDDDDDDEINDGEKNEQRTWLTYRLEIRE